MPMICFEVRTTHRCRIRGEPVEVGQVLTLPADQVRALLDCSRAELVNAEDEKALRCALAAEFERHAAAAPLFGQTAEAAAAQLRELEREQRPKARIGFLP